MRAVKFIGENEVACCDAPIPEINDTEVLIQVAFCGICGSDMYIYSGHHPRTPKGLTIGHEFSGTITKVGKNVSQDLKIGDRVTVNPLIFCGKCRACREGNGHVCKTLGLVGIDIDGGFAEYVKVEAKKVVKLPEGMTLENGALVEPLAVAVHAVRESSFKTGDKVLIIGAGPIGMLVAFAARISGASKVYMVELNHERYHFAKELGFEAFNSEEELGKAICGEEIDVVFEAVGIGPTMDTAVKYCKIRGQVVVVGVFKKPTPVDLQRIGFCEINIMGVRVYREIDFKVSAQMLTDHPEINRLATHQMKFEEAKEAFLTIKKGGPAMKLLLHP